MSPASSSALRVAVRTALAFLFAGAAAADACKGVDLLDQMAAEDPALHAEIYREAATHPNHEGLLWRIDAPGVAPSYLFGTMHVADHGTPELAKTVKAHIADARLLFTEMSLSENAAYNRELARRIVANPAPGLRERIGDNYADILAKKLRLRRIPTDILDTLPAWAAIELVWTADCEFLRHQSGDERPMLDHALMLHARDNGVPSLGFETVRKALNLHASQDEDVQIELLRIYLTDPEKERDFVTTDRNAQKRRETMATEIMYRKLYPRPEGGDAAELAAYDFWWDKIIVERNHDFVRRAAPQLRRGDVVIAVGAMHLPSHEGMVELLRAEGFTLTRID